MRLDSRDIAIILAALRTLQSLQRHSADIMNVATDGGLHKPMNDEEIDDLCERLNFDDDEESDDTIFLLKVSATEIAADSGTTAGAVKTALPRIREAISRSTIPESVNDIVFNVLARK